MGGKARSGIRTDPAHGIETARGNARDRVLSDDELRALGEALLENESKYPIPVAAVELIALTGLRREEACALRWSEIDFTGSCLRLETTKTGRSTRPIGQTARDLLKSLPRVSDEWVFPNRNGTGRAELKALIALLFDTAGLKDARSHDLRRTFGSMAADEGYSDATIAEMLGHSRRGVTQRHYIRRPDAALIAAAGRVSARIAAVLAGRETTAEVILLQVAGAHSSDMRPVETELRDSSRDRTRPDTRRREQDCRANRRRDARDRQARSRRADISTDPTGAE